MFNSYRTNSLLLVNWSAGDIKGKFRQLKYFISDWQPDIIVIQEIHLRPAGILKFPNYTTYRSVCPTYRVGCKTKVIRNSNNHKSTPISTTFFENTTVSTDMNDSKTLTISSIYRPSHVKINTSELKRIFNLTNKCITIGNFNAKQQVWSSSHSNSNGQIIHNFIIDKHLVLLPPTHPLSIKFTKLQHFGLGHPQKTLPRVKQTLLTISLAIKTLSFSS
ncbi:hypothetical protein AVEN_150288-1 [Araneus ventricosus]|uniref:Endonuclease/exonuclease/phosphatase domain-containing protein n=1 Tax=Araneus ventricosus TaxID=182803 RepID=A0A4Y2TER6_ARAVE|nr:hypothetical protein AVEN_113568-1 [Araneus ventricosus]GBN97946.1 hypothetical protein AVEN_173061-1 [Araneus ventricosus]GBN97972.1 hypothetical protein AVEN_180342-1 [Araneus ventricosus]GBN98005.1 hypothetical protein AVEN_150288-1 [Araneus ventricosus]